jgi:hypothetical protein
MFKRTKIVVIVLAVVIGLAWFYTSGQNFIGVSAVCYGYLLGWLSTWFYANRLCSLSHPVVPAVACVIVPPIPIEVLSNLLSIT